MYFLERKISEEANETNVQKHFSTQKGVKRGFLDFKSIKTSVATGVAMEYCQHKVDKFVNIFELHYFFQMRFLQNLCMIICP